MAAWIKLEHITPDKPEVVALAELLGIDQDAALGKCVRVWIWFDQQTADGCAPRVTPTFIDRLTNCPGFAQGLLEVGWLKDRNGRLSIPNSDRHNGQSAKRRALSSDRMRRSRCAPRATEAQQKRNQSKSKSKRDTAIAVSPPPAPPRGSGEGAPAAGRPREPNPLWDALCAAFRLNPVAKAERSRVGRVVAALREKGAAPGDIAERMADYRRSMPRAVCTPEALLKHWDQLAAGTLAYDPAGDPDATGDDGGMPPRPTGEALRRMLDEAFGGASDAV